MSVYNQVLQVCQILTGATGTGAGASVRLELPMGKFTAQTVVTGAPATATVKLQGSLDNANWTDLTTSTSVTGDQQYVVDKPVQFIRANVTALTGGTSPTVTVFVVGGR